MQNNGNNQAMTNHTVPMNEAAVAHGILSGHGNGVSKKDAIGSSSYILIKWLLSLLDDSSAKLAKAQSRIAELERQSTHDDMTGILNRRGFFENFAKEIDRTDRSHSQGGLLIMVDLDNFKNINDTYGHQAGDAALKLVAKTLVTSSRTMDSCARLGGDEFVLLLTDTAREKALARAQNLIKQLNSLSLVWYGAEIPVRASLGLKDYKKGDTIEAIFDEADAQMYDNKRANKGQGARTSASF